jgi:hypothetical protein
LLEENNVGDQAVQMVFHKMRRGIEKILLRNARKDRSLLMGDSSDEEKMAIKYKRKTS